MDCPYPPGDARGLSWNSGFSEGRAEAQRRKAEEYAKAKLRAKTNSPVIPSEETAESVKRRLDSSACSSTPMTLAVLVVVPVAANPM